MVDGPVRHSGLHSDEPLQGLFDAPRTHPARPLLLAAGASFANAAHAAEGDDRFAIRLGAMNIDSDNTLRGSTTVAGQDIS